MQAGSTAATTRRLTGGRIRGALISTAVVLALVAAPASALAGKPGSGGGTTPWIALASVNGAAGVQPTQGSTVAFATGYPSTTKNPWISLRCFQGTDLVFAVGGAPSSLFELGGPSSTWGVVGGSATCSAELGDLYWRGGHEYYTFLATMSFNAG